MLRGALIILLFCWSGWAAFGQGLPTSSHDSIVAAADDRCSHSGDSRSTSDSDHRWNASSRIDVSLTESVWKSSAVHAELSSARCAVAIVEVDRIHLSYCPTLDTPAHLLHIPLLI